MSSDGVPIIGPTPVTNLMVNTGHGHLGWTMAAGSAQLLADLMSGESPSIDPAHYALTRFGRPRLQAF
jgi:D-amino-acid dehydrogenase